MPFNPKMNVGSPIGGAGTPVQQPKAQTPPPLPKKAKTDPADKALADALDSANRQNTELQERIQQLTDELEGKEKELQVIQAKLEASPEPASDDELANAIEARKAAEDVIDRLEREISELKASGNQTANLQKELDEALAALKATTVPKSDDTYDYLIAEREKVEEECGRLQTELKEAKAQADDLQNKLHLVKAEAESDLRKKTSQIAELEEKIRALKSAPSETEDQESHVKNLELDLQTKEQKIRNLMDQVATIEGEKKSLAREISELKAVPTTPFPVADHSICNQKIQDLNQKVQKLNEDLQKAYLRGQYLESTIKTEESKWIDAQKAQKQAQEIANALHAFLGEIDPEPTGDPKLRHDRIKQLKEKKVVEIPVSTKTSKAKIFFFILIVLVALVAGISIGHCVSSAPQAATADAATASSASAEKTVTPIPELPVTVQTPMAAAKTPKPPTTEKCYPANPRSILALLNQKSDDATVLGKVRINAPRGAKRITCDKDPVFENGRTDLSGCKICVPYGPGKYPASDSKYVSAILGREDALCYDYRARTPVSEWSDKTIHLDCKNRPDYFIPTDCRDITGCDIVVPDPNKIACDTCTD